MSILIKGMKMPKEGTVFVIDSAGQVWSNEWPTKGYTRLDGLTAVPVPPHGRLIDADALEYHADNVRDPMGRTEKTVMWKKIEAAPTIIPEDGGAE